MSNYSSTFPALRPHPAITSQSVSQSVILPLSRPAVAQCAVHCNFYRQAYNIRSKPNYRVLCIVPSMSRQLSRLSLSSSQVFFSVLMGAMNVGQASPYIEVYHKVSTMRS